MTIKEAATKIGCSVLFLREWADKGSCPFCVAVNISGGKRRTFLINEAALNKYLKGEK